MLAKALAHYFESKLLLLDITDFSVKVIFHGFSFYLIYLVAYIYFTFYVFPCTVAE